MLRSPLWVSALVVAKVNRFELTVALVGAMIAAIAAVLTAGTFGAIQPPPDCLRAWVASVQVTPECQSAVEQWSALSEGITGKVMAAMAVVPAAAGLLFGVPVVAREIEAGTAPFVWAVAGSRTRWLVRQVVPLLAVLVLALGILSIAAGLLADARSGGNVWSSTFADAELFGPTLVARGLVAFTLGVFVGALVGRILPAVLVAAALAVGVTVVAASAQGMVVQSTYQLSDVGAPGSAVAFVRSNPDVEVLFVLPSGEIVTRAETPRVAPPGNEDPIVWVAERARLVPLGVSRAATARWQTAETAGLLGVAVLVLGLAMATVRRRTPR